MGKTIGLAAAACAGAAGPVAAQVPVLPTPVVIQDAADSLAQDAREYAARFGVAPDEAARRLRLQEASVPLSEALGRAYRDRLAGIFIEHRPDYRLVVLLAGDDPVPVAAVPAGPPELPVLFRTGAPATRDRILLAIQAHQADLRAAVSVPPGMGVDARTGRMIVLVRDGDAAGEGRDALAARLATIAGVAVEVRALGDADQDLDVTGGGRLVGVDVPGGHRFVCTAGFAVTDGAQTAIATAAHCPDALSAIDPDGGVTPLDMVGAWGARFQDVQIHRAPGAVAPFFYADTDRRWVRPVTSARTRAGTRAGDFVCHRGERTGYSCAPVDYVDYAPPGDLCAGPCSPSWVAVRGPDCRGGDSGGPVFAGTIAFGLLKGSTTADGTCRLYYYMAVDDLPSPWRVATRRQP